MTDVKASASASIEVRVFATPDDLRAWADRLEEKARTTDYGGDLTAHTVRTRDVAVHFVCDQGRMNCEHEKYRSLGQRQQEGVGRPGTEEPLVDSARDREFVTNQSNTWGWDGEHIEDAVGYAAMYRAALVSLGILQPISPLSPDQLEEE